MAAVDVLADTLFGDQDTVAVDWFVGAHEFPVRNSQIAGLQQVAINEPWRVKEFADTQRKRAEKKFERASPGAQQAIGDEIAFWNLVSELCEGKARHAPSSLLQRAEAMLPADLRLGDVAPKSQLTMEERAERTALKERRQQWLDAWRKEHYPAFFRRFCAHYRYRLGQRQA